MKKRRLAKNTIASFVFQISAIVCGFILPRLILQYFGSEVNGLVNSINQFLAIISFLELGVGAVVQSTLYKPLAQNDNNTISKIMVSAVRFFRRLAKILLVYILVLVFLYPLIVKKEFGWFFTSTLIISISISSFAQYYFGVVDQILLTADQKGYIQYNAQTTTLLIGTLVCAGLIQCGSSIHIVKLTTSLIYLVRPIFLRMYVNRFYSINRSIQYEVEPIKQKWNGVAQHVAAVILDSTDLIVLTTFADLSAVSIYYVYHLVVCGVKQLLISMTNGIHALIGELWAKQEIQELKMIFGWTEWCIHTATTIVFGCTGTLLVPFVSIYTLGITDAEYIQPLFAILITVAHAGHCLRLPYSIMILAGGHFKETQNNYIIAALLNITLSIVTVKLWGLIGVAIGTIIAMSYQTIWMATYISKYLIKWPKRYFVKQVTVDIIIVMISSVLCRGMQLRSTTYVSWIILAIKVGIIWGIISCILNSIMYRDKVRYIIKSMKKRVHS